MNCNWSAPKNFAMEGSFPAYETHSPPFPQASFAPRVLNQGTPFLKFEGRISPFAYKNPIDYQYAVNLIIQNGFLVQDTSVYSIVNPGNQYSHSQLVHTTDIAQPLNNVQNENVIPSGSIEPRPTLAHTINNVYTNNECASFPQASSELNVVNQHSSIVQNTEEIRYSSGKAKDTEMVLESVEHKGYTYKVVMALNPKTCNLCDRRYATEKALRTHYKRSHSKDSDLKKQARDNAQRALCVECSRCFMNNVNLRRHKAKIHKKTDIKKKCLQCGAHFSSQYAYAMHRKDVHGLQSESKIRKNSTGRGRPKVSTRMVDLWEGCVKVYTCTTCKHHAASKGNIERHINIKHVKLREHECPWCKKKFPTKDNLEIHQTTKKCIQKSS